MMRSPEWFALMEATSKDCGGGGDCALAAVPVAIAPTKIAEATVAKNTVLRTQRPCRARFLIIDCCRFESSLIRGGRGVICRGPGLLTAMSVEMFTQQ